MGTYLFLGNTMSHAATVCVIVAIILWARTIYAIKRMNTPDGNIEGFGLLFFGPMAILATFLAALFGILSNF